MSKYIEDVQGKIVSNPINETNTKYGFNEKSEDGIYYNDNYPIDTQYMYNYDEPVSDIDTAYYDDYRNKIEELRKRTESTYEALESCLVPVEIPGMSFQPYEFQTTETDDGEVIKEKQKSFTYFFQDHLSPIGEDSKEFVFRTNKVKFIDDRHRRLIYDRTIHLMTLKEDEDNKVSFRNVLLRTFFEYYNKNYYPLTRTVDAININIDSIINDIYSNIINSGETYTVLDSDGEEKTLSSKSDFDLVFQSGQDIDTLIPSTVYNLYNIGWLEASVMFLNGIIIPWTKIIISVDNIDTFIIISKLLEATSNLLDDDKDIYLDYVHIPFKVAYASGKISSSDNSLIYYKYTAGEEINKDNDIIFIIDKYGGVRFSSLTTNVNFRKVSISDTFDRIMCLDPNIKYAEFSLDSDLKDIGIEYTKTFKDFCGNDYRCKLKQFNFLGFELDRYYENDVNYKGTFKNDDFTVTWHPFNIMDIRFKRLFNRKRVFKVFYNTKVLYDQDNILRIKNHDYLFEEYERYRQDVTANIETYLNEIYILAKKDIGTYITTDGKMYGYKYHYVTPYECFLLYNAINTSVYHNAYTSFDDFRNINVAGLRTDSSRFKTIINTELTANSEGKCVWVIPIGGNNQRPAVKITRLSDGDTVLADINFKDDNSQIIITMSKDGNNIAAGSYRATLYYADVIRYNPDLKSSNGKCVWTMTGVDLDTTVTAVYNANTNQIVLTDIEKVDDTTFNITIYSDEDIITRQFIAVLNTTTNTVDKGSILNYMNGGFIAIPSDEDSMFLKMVKEKDIYEDDKVTVRDDIKEYFENIAESTSASLVDILVPIDNESRTDSKTPSDSFYMYEGDSKGKIIPYLSIYSEFGMEQEYTDVKYDILKLRFELSYLNNMEEGATPVDEFIYYFDNSGVINMDKYPVVEDNNITFRTTAIDLNALAKNIFKLDPQNVYSSIEKMNWSADYIIPQTINGKRENCLVTLESEPPTSSYDYRLDPRFYYNYGYRDGDDNTSVHKVVSEWGLRRNLPEMFYWSLDKDEYTLDSMHLLDEVFDFTYDFNKTYEQNLEEGTNYVIGYDADKLEQSIKRSVVSFSKKGSELKDHMSRTQCVKSSSLGGYKIITFIKNKNQKIVFDNISITVATPQLAKYINPVPVTSVTYTTKGDSKENSFINVDMKHNSQENYTIKKTNTSFTDVDKNFTQEFDSYKFNRETELLEYYKGNELVVTVQVDKIIDNSRLQMSRWNISQQDNYVMIFKNRKLYDKYNTIEYDDISFSVDFYNVEIKDDDEFEFVFFLNANNTIMKKICETDDDIKLKLPDGYYSNSANSIRLDMNGDLMDKGLYTLVTGTTEFDCAIPCNTSIIDAENVQLLVNEMPKDEDDKYTVTDTTNTTYELDFSMKSYRTKVETKNNNGIERRFIHQLTDDNKLNGLHRVTKQGGGEYILLFDGKVPENTGSEDNETTIVTPGTGGNSNLGIGLLALATKNVNRITFNGTVEQWEAISKTKPWVRSVINLQPKGIKCTDGIATVGEGEAQDGTTAGV
jgi:hypothetical protein